MNQAAFLEAILAEPDEPAHRLVYADWLDDQGESDRAEFIRLQVGRETLVPWSRAARASLAREQQLLNQHGAEWAGDIARIATRYRFHGGFVEEISIPCDRFLAEGHVLLRLAPIRRLNLRHTQALIGLLNDEKNQNQLAKLLAGVMSLDLTREYLDERSGLLLLNLPTVPPLRELYLWNSSLTAAGLELLAEQPVLDGLESLGLRGLHEEVNLLLRSPRLGRLRRLHLNADSALAVWLSKHPLLRQLEELTLSHGSLSSEAVEALVGSPLVGGLERLDLSFVPFDRASLRALANENLLGRLRWLNLSMSLRNTGIDGLVSSPLLRRLEGLDLSLNRLSHQAAKLCRHKGACRLETLDLLYNDISASVQAKLAERFGDDVCLFSR